MHNQPLFASKQTFARIAFLGKVGDWWTKRALIMLKFLLKTRQDQIVPHTRVWAKVRKTFTLPLPVRVVAGHVAHSQRRRYHENAEVIYHRQPVFNL